MLEQRDHHVQEASTTSNMNCSLTCAIKEMVFQCDEYNTNATLLRNLPQIVTSRLSDKLIFAISFLVNIEHLFLPLLSLNLKIFLSSNIYISDK